MSTFNVKQGYLWGMKLDQNDATPASKADIKPGECACSSDCHEMHLNETVEIDITASGANGLDAGSEAASAWYAVHVIGDSSRVNPTAGLFSLSADSPTLPSGYDIARRVGWVRNDSAGDFVGWRQKGNGTVRRYYYDATFAARRVLSNGNATTYTTVDCSGIMPETASLGFFSFEFETGTSGQAADVLRVKPPGVANALVRVRAGLVSAEKITVPDQCPTSPSQTLQYQVTRSANAATIAVMGYEDEL